MYQNQIKAAAGKFNTAHNNKTAYDTFQTNPTIKWK